MNTRTVSFPELTPEQLRIHQAGLALRRDGASPAGALELLAAIVEDRTWERLIDKDGRSFVGRFREFVEAREPFGLGFNPDQLPKVLGLRHPHEGSPKVAERMANMRQAVGSLLRAEIPAVAALGEVGRGRNRVGDTNPISRPNQVEHVVARLKRDNPELADRVVAGEVTPNAAALQMGWRHPRIVVSSPESVAEGLRRHMSAEDRARLVELLQE